MSLPNTYKQAVFKAQGEPLTLEDVELRLPSSNEILIKVEACGVCHSDVFAQYNGMGGGFPMVPGHEIVGRVAAVGSGVVSWKTGDRIAAGWHGGHDGTCKACTSGLYHMCDNPIINGENKNGGYAEYCTIRAESGVRVPNHVDAATYAPILCAGVTVFNSIRHMNIKQGSTVAVQGLGGLGHLALQYAKRMGYRVVAISRGAEKEAAAREFGADEYIDASKGDVGEALKALGGAALAVSTATSSEAIGPLIKGLGILGKLLVLSLPGDLTIDTYAMIKYGASVQVWPGGHAGDSADAIAFADLHKIETVIEKFPLSDVNAAYDAMLSGNVRFRAVLVME